MPREPEQIAQVALLDDDLRREMYDFVRSLGRAVTREEVARELGVSTNLVAFHLDKLTAAGLLQARYGRPVDHPATTGRAPKLYEPSDAEIAISIPSRRHEILARVLLRALANQAEEEPPIAALERVARQEGVGMGESARKRLRPGRGGQERVLRIARSVLADCGYEPYVAATGETRLRNCPFSPLAEESAELICAMNRALIEGVLQGLGAEPIRAELEPLVGECCVALRRPRDVA